MPHITLFFLLISILILSSCGIVHSESSNKPDLSETKSVVVKSAIRSFRDVGLCFVDTIPTNRETVRAWILEEFNFRTKVVFHGFQDCNTVPPYNKANPQKNPFIRLKVINKTMDDFSTGSVIFAGFSCLGPCDPGSSGYTATAILEKGTIIHELMHGLGFDHEHIRTDRKNICPLASENIKAESTGVIYEGSYDPDSIMNYCNSSSSLSVNDIAAINKYYWSLPLEYQEISQTHASAGSTPAVASRWLPILDRNGESDCDWIKRIMKGVLGGTS